MNTSLEPAIYDLKRRQTKPLCAYIYDLVGLETHVRNTIASLPERCQMFYAMKANSEQRILETLAPLVYGFEVASQGEIAKARSIDPQIPIIFGGPGKTDHELAAALTQGILLIHVESVHELRRLEWLAEQMNREVSILLRVNLRSFPLDATLHMAGRPTQFGIDERDIPQVIQLCQQLSHIHLEGFHFHSISNDLDAGQHIQLIQQYCRLVRSWSDNYNLNISKLNVGGGIGINFTNTEQQFDWAAFVTQLQCLCHEEMPAHWEIFFECGRYLTAACGTYAVEVLDIKRNHDHSFLIVAGGSHHFRLPTSWQHNHPFSVLPIHEWRYSFPRSEVVQDKVTITGQLCTPKDVFARDVFISHIRVGDILCFQYAGAYGWSISHHDFLSHPHPDFVYLEDSVAKMLTGDDSPWINPEVCTEAEMQID